MARTATTARRTLDAAEESIERSSGGPPGVVILLACVYGMDAADKATLSALAGSLKAAFHIGNLDLGILIAATSFVGAVFTLPIGALVDRIDRRPILIWAVTLWTITMVASGFAMSYLYLLVVRVVMGAVTAAAAPTTASLVGDLFPARTRANTYGMILAGELVGSGLGFFAGGELASWLDWRWAFYLAGVPSAALVWAVWRFLPEPERGRQSAIDLGGDQDARGKDEQSHSQDVQRNVRQAGAHAREGLILHEDPSRRSLWWAIGYLLHLPTYVLLIIASALGYYFFAGLRAFGMIYFTEHYGLSRSLLSALMVLVGVGAIAGVILGGRASGWLLRRGWPDARIVVPGIALSISVVFCGPAIWIANPYIGVPLLTVGAAFLAAANAPIDAARLDVIHPRLWGRAEAGRMALRAALEGGAPIIFGWMSNVLGGGQTGLQWTYLLMLIPLIVAAALAIPLRSTYPRDVATVAASVKAISGRS